MPSRPVVFTAALTLVVGLGVPPRPLPSRTVAIPRVAGAAARTSDDDSVPCPAGTLPDGDVCVRLGDDAEGSEGQVVPMAHRARTGQLAAYDQIPRRPERPIDYDAYRYPVPPGAADGHAVVSGYDLDRPDAEQRRGPALRATGHGGVDLPQHRGTPVTLVALEGQRGDATVVYAGPLFGTTVVTRHTLVEGGRARDYVLLFGHLERAAAGLEVGATVKEGSVIGYVGDTGSPELVHLHLEARRVRDAVDVSKVEPSRLVANEVSIVCDPRNVLPLRDGEGH